MNVAHSVIIMRFFTKLLFVNPITLEIVLKQACP